MFNVYASKRIQGGTTECPMGEVPLFEGPLRGYTFESGNPEPISENNNKK